MSIHARGSAVIIDDKSHSIREAEQLRQQAKIAAKGGNRKAYWRMHHLTLAIEQAKRERVQEWPA